jgi:regulatory protein
MKTKAKDYALRLLSVRDRSLEELRTRLSGRGYENEEIETVISDLVSAGLLDDEKFAEAFVESKVARMWGWRRIRIELSRKGVREPMARRAFARVYDPEEMSRNAIERARLLWDRHSGRPAKDRQRRIYEFFARLGHEPDFIKEIIERCSHRRPEIEGEEVP